MSFINDRFRRLVDAHHRKNSGGKRQMISLGSLGMGGHPGAGGGEGGAAAGGGGVGGGQGDADSNSSTYAEASIRSDPNVYAGYTSETKLPFSAFQSLRKQPQEGSSSSTVATHSPEIKLTDQQEANVRKALKKVAEGQSHIDESHPFVSAFIEKHCTALSEYLPNNVTRAGASWLVLAVMCGHKELAQECLQLKAQLNSAAYLSWPAPPANEMEGEAPMTRHGFTPLYLAVICQRIEMAELLFESGATVGTTDRWGRTPLHAAYTLKDDAMVNWLLTKKDALQSAFDRDKLRPGEDVYDVFPPPLARPRVQMGAVIKDTGKNQSGKAEDQQLVCTATGNVAAMCHCQDCMEERLRLERAISNWLSPQYLEVLAAAADMERDQREAKDTQAAAAAHARVHQQQLAEALNTVVREQQIKEQREAATNAAAGTGGGEQAPSPAAVVGETS